MPPKLLWDLATAYDLFVSLYVLHYPNKYELRGAWAAGIRSRLSPADREMMERATELIIGPLHWIHALPPPKDGVRVATPFSMTSPPLEAVMPETTGGVRSVVVKVNVVVLAWLLPERSTAGRIVTS